MDARQPLLGSGGAYDEKQSSMRGLECNDIRRDPPLPSWVWARKDRHGRRLPQIISHRGYKAANPENTMASFKGAVDAGTHAIETDIHLTRDEVVVLSHDPDLKRCFDRKPKIIDCDWSYISTLRTTASPHEHMPKLTELLEYLADPSRDHLWVLLDIKLDNNADDVMRLIASAIASVSPSPNRPWSDRLVLGIWAAKFLPLCAKYLPGYPMSHIGFSTTYARQFLKVPNVSFNMLQKVLLGPIGKRFIKDVKKAHRPLFVWTVNDDNLMKWSIQKEVDGVITDNPKRFKEICDEWDDELEPIARVSIAQWLYTFWLWMLVFVFSFTFRKKFPQTVEDYLRMRQIREKASMAFGS